MTSVFLAPTVGIAWQAFTVGGQPLNQGKLYTYEANSTTPLATYTTSAGITQNDNPIVLGVDGRPPHEIWLLAGNSYRFDLTTSTDDLIETYDYVPGINDVAGYSPIVYPDGVLKGVGGNLAKAVAGTDYAPPSSGAVVLKGNNVGGFAAATPGTDYPGLASNNTFTKANRGAYVNLTSTSNSIAVNLALSNNYKHTLTEDTTLAAPSNIVAGQSGCIEITQHASSAKTLAYNSFWKWAGGTPGTVSATTSSKNVICYVTDSGGTFATCTMNAAVA